MSYHRSLRLFPIVWIPLLALSWKVIMRTTFNGDAGVTIYTACSSHVCNIPSLLGLYVTNVLTYPSSAELSFNLRCLSISSILLRHSFKSISSFSICKASISEALVYNMYTHTHTHSTQLLWWNGGNNCGHKPSHHRQHPPPPPPPPPPPSFSFST